MCLWKIVEIRWKRYGPCLSVKQESRKYTSTKVTTISSLLTETTFEELTLERGVT
jgi:hypothetical protein